jgi:hypothetical protein
MHKGFKCLDISKGRIYISMIFDESMFLFASLNSNASTRYTSEVLLIIWANEITNPINISTASTLPMFDLPVQNKSAELLLQPIPGIPPPAPTCATHGTPHSLPSGFGTEASSPRNVAAPASP